MKFITRTLIYAACLLHQTIIRVKAAALEHSSEGTGVGTTASRLRWWNSLESEEKNSVISLFESSWFEKELDQDGQIAYAYTAQQVYDFLESGADSDETDHYIGFAPLLLRTSFHSAGTFSHPTGTGGTNGGTIFNKGELQDESNGCIDTATTELFSIFHGNNLVSLADSVVIAAVVALDVMNFPRMDLVAMTGGRMTVKDVAFRDRLSSPDDDPLIHFQTQYDLTKSQTVALIGGAHNFGAAHGKCSGYVGQWTPEPLDWFGPDSTAPTFFSDLLREDWRWYEVCTYQNNTVSYTSIEDPLASGAKEEEEEEEEEVLVSSCAITRSRAPIVCEEQAMRGCEFDDGIYPLDWSPCDIDVLQLRLKSDFFLKVNPEMLPFAKKFAKDPDLLAEEFGLAYHKMTHNGLDRCGLSGHGCAAGHACKVVGDDPLSAICVFDGDKDKGKGKGKDESEAEKKPASKSSAAMTTGNNERRSTLVALGTMAFGFVLVIVLLLVLAHRKMKKLVNGTSTKDVSQMERYSSESTSEEA